MKLSKILSMFAVCLVLSGCGTMYEPDPVGTGYGINELKLSPCSCIKVKQRVGSENPWSKNQTA